MANNPDLCDNGASTCESENKKHNRTILIATTIPIAVTLFVAAFYVLHRMRKKTRYDFFKKLLKLYKNEVYSYNMLFSYRYMDGKQIKV
jgi:hypothetical protein